MDFAALNMKGVQAAENIADPFLKIAIVGDPGVGKSWLAATAPGPVLDLDFDGRAASLQGKKDIFVKTYWDDNQMNPQAVANFESDLSALKYAKSQGKEIPRTFVIDSISYARKSVEAELIRQQATLGRVVKVGTTNLKIGAGWDIINANRLYLEYIISELAALGNVIAIFHSMDEKDVTKSTATEKKYTGKITIQPQYLNTILSIFNDVWLMDIDYSNKRFVQTGVSSIFVGKCSLKGLLDKEEPDIAKMLQKHKDFVAKNATK